MGKGSSINDGQRVNAGVLRSSAPLFVFERALGAGAPLLLLQAAADAAGRHLSTGDVFLWEGRRLPAKDLRERPSNARAGSPGGVRDVMIEQNTARQPQQRSEERRASGG